MTIPSAGGNQNKGIKEIVIPFWEGVTKMVMPLAITWGVNTCMVEITIQLCSGGNVCDIKVLWKSQYLHQGNLDAALFRPSKGLLKS